GVYNHKTIQRTCHRLSSYFITNAAAMQSMLMVPNNLRKGWAVPSAVIAYPEPVPNREVLAPSRYSKNFRYPEASGPGLPTHGTEPGGRPDWREPGRPGSHLAQRRWRSRTRRETDGVRYSSVGTRRFATWQCQPARRRRLIFTSSMLTSRCRTRSM